MPGRVGGFSQYQVHLHFPDPNELPTPTLRDGGLDQGAWFFDGQTAGDTLSSGIEFATDEWLETWMPADMDLPQAWAITRGSPDVVIAVLDPHGVDWQHPDLSGLQAPDNSLPVEDAILSLVGGNIWRNDRDLPGIQSAPGGDEDNDGKIDEDFFNQEPGELPELASVGMPAGSATGTGTYSIEFSGVSWTPGEWAGDTLFFLSRSDVPGSPLGETRFAVAVDSNSTSTLWTGCPIANVVAWEAQNGWVYYESWVSNYSAWLVNSSEADHIDNDGDGNVDEYWGYLEHFRADDDENGRIDDSVGWDFWGADFGYEVPGGYPEWSVEASGYANDSRPGALSERTDDVMHGTRIAGIVAAIASSDGWGMVGIAPETRIMPIQTNSIAFDEAVLYVLDLKDEFGEPVVDVITWSTRNVGDQSMSEEALALAEAQGVVFCAAVDNDGGYNAVPYMAHVPETTLSVGGAGWTQSPWTESEYGPWVDIAARAPNIIGPTRCDSKPGACDSGLETRGNWEFGWSGAGNSWAAPQVAAIAALVKSAYPYMSAAEIRDRVRRGVDELHYPPDMQDRVGNLGSGRANAYKALTWYGDISYASDPGFPPSQVGPSSATTWQNEVWISGDIHVPAGHTLTIEPGTIVHVAQDDIWNMGDHPTMVEWFIEGTVDWQGTTESPIVFECFTDVGDSLWVSPAWASTATVNVANAVYADVEFADGITAPDGTETFIAGQYIPVTWSTAEFVPANAPGTGPYTRVQFVDIELSLNGGHQFTTIATGVTDVLAGEFRCPTPFDADTSQAVLRVVFRDKAGIQVAADVTPVFTIEPLQMAATGDATGLDMGNAPYATLLLDADGDGDQDLLISYSMPLQDAVMYEASQNFATPSVPRYEPITGNALPDAPSATRSGHVADYDGDGKLDIILTGDSRAWLLKNDPDATYPIRFTDVTASHGDLAAGDDDSWSAAFADFDRDGDLDLYIGRGGSTMGQPGDGLPDLLLKQNDLGQFVDISAARGILAAPHITSTVLAWGDYDADADLDLFVGHGGGVETSGDPWESKLYSQAYDPTDERIEFSASMPLTGTAGDASRYVTGALWADIDRDGILDLVVSAEDETGALSSGVYWGDGVGGFGTPTALVPANGVSIGDLDLDGWPELLLTHAPSGQTQLSPVLLRATDPATPRVLVDRTAVFGLGSTAIGLADAYRSMVVADLGGEADGTGDGDLDILLGRATGTNHEVFVRNPVADDTSLAPDWLRVRLEGLQATANTESGLGAEVTVTTDPGGPDERLQTQVMGVDTSGAPTDELVFGLGNAGSGAQLTVKWPDSYEQDVSSISAGVIGDSVLVVVDDHAPALIGSSAQLQVFYKPGQLVDLVFTWDTDHSSDPALDLVTIKVEPGLYCTETVGPLTAGPGSPDVTHRVWAVNAGRFRHELIWADRDCYGGCPLQYKVQSGTSEGNHGIGWKLVKIPICIN